MPFSIGLIVGSMRNPRICPQVADFVLGTIQAAPTQANDKPTIHKIDLAAWNLPMFDEPDVPSLVKDPENYAHEHTRAWSREISKHDAFIFVSPQYNWGYPASLKNAIDFLFNEWVGKPGMIVTYGGYGGGKCGAQLENVLQGIRMHPISTRVELQYPSFEFAKEKAFPGKDLGLDPSSDESVWASKRNDIVAAFEELEKAVSTKTSNGSL